jgi:superfamily I DNA and/or RNA helicase
MMLNWEHLPNPEVPVIFHAVIGQDMQEKNSPSFFNPHEVSKVLQYVGWLVGEKSPRGTKIRATDISIISPYRKQVSLRLDDR